MIQISGIARYLSYNKMQLFASQHKTTYDKRCPSLGQTIKCFLCLILKVSDLPVLQSCCTDAQYCVCTDDPSETRNLLIDLHHLNRSEHDNILQTFYQLLDKLQYYTYQVAPSVRRKKLKTENRHLEYGQHGWC